MSTGPTQINRCSDTSKTYSNLKCSKDNDNCVLKTDIQNYLTLG